MATLAGRRFCVSTVANVVAGRSYSGAARLGRGVCAAAVTNAGRRAIHGSPVVMKKKSKVVIEDLFDDEPEAGVGDLLADPQTGPSSNVTSTATPAAKDGFVRMPSKHLSPDKRHAQFEERYSSLLPHLDSNLKGRRKLPPIRYSVWTALVQLAQNEEELRRVMDVIPKWKDAKRHEKDKGGLTEQWGELFVTRAESLSCPTLALELFSNHAKYQIPLSLPAARHLLHSLHGEHSTEDVMTAVALYRVYGLRPIANDLVSLGLVCRTLVSQVYTIPKPPAPSSNSQESENTPESIPPSTKAASKEVLDALLISLRQMLSKTNPSSYAVSPHARTRSLTPAFSERQRRAMHGQPAKEKEKTWLMRCLARIEKSVSSESQKGLAAVKWLRNWRERAGHVEAEPKTTAATA